MSTFITIVVLIIVGAVGIGVLKGMRRAKLKTAYEQALQGTDKMYALNCGRLYYATFNKGNVVTAADEARIGNELSTMKV